MDQLINFNQNRNKQVYFNAIKISIANPDQILSWSNGEIKKPETINYRTFKPERDGLFCSRIFGPMKDYECLCGKYKRMKYKGVVCEKCGVEVTLSKVRRERMGHIVLAAPVAHIWFLKSMPSRLGLALDMTLKDLEKVLYFEKYIVVEPGLTSLKHKQLLTEDEFLDAQEDFGEDSFTAMIGAEALNAMLIEIDIAQEITDLRSAMVTSSSQTKIKRIIKRLKMMESLHKSRTKLEWMILKVLPVIPPELRPLVPLEGGRFATSDLNDFYRRVINRNNRLRRLIELRAPDIIIRNEKRMLQESVDSLFDNGRRGKPIVGTGKRPLKSLSEMLKGKQGRFRQNLLGKRVDYSGRSVIVVGPELKLHQCGLPKKMALELFKPFVLSKLEIYGYANSIRSAKRMMEREQPEVWDILDEVIKEHPVLLNRAPTLHRLGIQAFEPLLTEGKAIQLHPLVCAAFNADFDGDQMAIHVPLSIEAQLEARVLMMSTNNILSPANGKPIIIPDQDIVLGLYYITYERLDIFNEEIKIDKFDVFKAAIDLKEIMIKDIKNPHNIIDLDQQDIKDIFTKVQAGEYSCHRILLFATMSEIEFAMANKNLHVQSRIKAIYYQTQSDGSTKATKVITTPGRILLSQIFPKNHKLTFDQINQLLIKKDVSNIIDNVYRHCGQKETVIFCDKLMKLGYDWACRSGISFGKDDLLIPSAKRDEIAKTQKKVSSFEKQYLEGLITWQEKYNKVVDAWSKCTDKISDYMIDGMSKVNDGLINSVYMMAHSGARGSTTQIKQLAGMRGLMAKPSGEIIERPIISNFKEGLNVLEYFNSTHGARKGLADTALKTANSGYLTRRLVDVAQDCVIIIDDCGTTEGLLIKAAMDGAKVIESLGERILGRTVLDDVIDPDSSEVIIKNGEIVDEAIAKKIDQSGIISIKVRSVLTCEAGVGLCGSCYGRDLARGTKVNIGEAVGVIAAQSIGEPGTQLTMRTFHIGGAALSGGEESSFIANFAGKLKLTSTNIITDKQSRQVILSRHCEAIILDGHNNERQKVKLPFGARLSMKDGDEINIGDTIAICDPYNLPIISEIEGHIKLLDLEVGVTMHEEVDEETGIANKVVIEATSLSKDQTLKPRIVITDEEGNIYKHKGDSDACYYLSAGTVISVDEGQKIFQGDVIARMPRASSVNRDITGGLPRVAELFEARGSNNPSVISEIDGYVRYGVDKRKTQKIIIEPIEKDAAAVEYNISKGNHIAVQEGDRVFAGDQIVLGNPSPHEMLRIFGIPTLADYFVTEVQEVYRMQGVKINDKHIEVIIRQMLRKVEIVSSGDSLLLAGEQIERDEIEKINEELIAEGKEPAKHINILLGITRASLNTQSFISAASFQETTKVLTEASISGKIDTLKGLKENVIVGRLIPAGTGVIVDRLKNIAKQQKDQFITEN